jgi:hypothetical protein
MRPWGSPAHGPCSGGGFALRIRLADLMDGALPIYDKASSSRGGDTLGDFRGEFWSPFIGSFFSMISRWRSLPGVLWVGNAFLNPEKGFETPQKGLRKGP